VIQVGQGEIRIRDMQALRDRSGSSAWVADQS
jgi:hypothetical protein